MFVTIHTAFDFDLSCLVTICNYYMFIAIINNEDRNIKKNNKWLDSLSVILLLTIIVTNLFRVYGEKLQEKSNYTEAIKYYPYSSDIKSSLIENLTDKSELKQRQVILIDYIENETNVAQTYYVEELYNNSIRLIKDGDIETGIFGLKTIDNTLMFNDNLPRVDIFSIYERATFTKNLIQELQEINKDLNSEELKIIYTDLGNKFLSEYDDKIEQIKDKEKNQYEQEIIDKTLEQYSRLYTEIFELLE